MRDSAIIDLLANIKDIGDINITTDWIIEKLVSVRPIFKLRLSGYGYNQTVPYNLSTTLVELQKIIYRSYALVAYGSPSIGKLTDVDKQKLDMPFRVDKGSSSITFDLTSLLVGVITGISDHMTPTLLFAIIVIIIASWTSSHVYQKYIDFKKDERADLLEKEQLNIFAESSKEKEKTTREALRMLGNLAERNQLTSKLYKINSESLPEVILKAATQAETTEFNGVYMGKSEALELSRTENEKFTPFKEDWNVKVLSLSTTNEDEEVDNSGWKLKVYSEGLDKELTVTIPSPAIFDTKKSSAITESLLRKSFITIGVSGKKNKENTSFKELKLESVSEK